MTRSTQVLRLTATASYPSIVGTVLAERRRQQGLTQTVLADRMGLKQSAWSKVERGVSALTVEQLAEAAEQLDTTPGEILSQADQTADFARDRGIEVENKRLSEKGLPLGATALKKLLRSAIAGEF